MMVERWCDLDDARQRDRVDGIDGVGRARGHSHNTSIAANGVRRRVVIQQ